MSKPLKRYRVKDKNGVMRTVYRKLTPSQERKHARKIRKVMGEYKRKTLKSSSGQSVTNSRQAYAITRSEADRYIGVAKRR